MRLLFVSNFFAPADLGGYEQWCQEVADALMTKGHQISVLTSRHGLHAIRETEPHVDRALFLESGLDYYRPRDLLLLPWRGRQNAKHLRKTINEFQPDIIFVWGMWQLNPQLAVLAEDLCPGRVTYYFCGFWPIKELEKDPHTSFWESREQKVWIRLLKRPVAWTISKILEHQRHRGPQCLHMACVSQFVLDTLRSGGLEPADGRVIYGGIDLKRFHRPLDAAREHESLQNPLRLLYAGRVSPVKGVDTAIEAMVRIAHRHDPADVNLTIVGSGHPDFVEYLQHFVREQGIESYVTFHGRVQKYDMPQILHEFDVLLFPSTWEEPLARTMMEGLAAGLTLVSTTTGGSKEILEHGQNCLTFQAGDAEDLAQQLERLLTEPLLGRQLAQAGQQTALDRLAFDRMVDELELFLSETARRNPIPSPCMATD
jgi:glycosyltransferase involved in cell wall biosynthesis